MPFFWKTNFRNGTIQKTKEKQRHGKLFRNLKYSISLDNRNYTFKICYFWLRKITIQQPIKKKIYAKVFWYLKWSIDVLIYKNEKKCKFFDVCQFCLSFSKNTFCIKTSQLPDSFASITWQTIKQEKANERSLLFNIVQPKNRNFDCPIFYQKHFINLFNWNVWNFPSMINKVF